MKIIYVTAALPYSTQEAFIIPEIAELQRLGHEILIVPRSPVGSVVHGDARALTDSTLARPLGSPSIVWPAICEAVRRPARAAKMVRSILASRSAPMAARNLAVFAKGVWLADVARKWRADHIHCHWAATTATMAMTASELSGIPWSFTAHRWDIVENNLLESKLRSAAFGRFISQSGIEILRDHGIDAPIRNVRLIHMGVNLPKIRIDAAQWQWPPIVVCPANLVPVKGHIHLLRAFELLKRRGSSLTLLIAGEGELKSELENEVQRLGIEDTVRFLGHVPHDELLARYGRGEIGAVILPSVDLGNGLHEGIPVALIEAMAIGVPVISTCTGGIPELLHDGAGMLVPPADPEALADVIECTMVEGELRRRLACTARSRVEHEFAIESIAQELIDNFSSARYLH